MKRHVGRLMEERKQDCVGCHACFSICPVKAISMKEDAEGFLYPAVDEETCIACGACLRVCQVVGTREPEGRIPTEAYACMNQNTEERLASSSGGVFIVLAKHVISQGGYVFGAAFDENMNLRHTYANDLDGCRAFMGSKYLQSTIGTSYSDAKRFLEQGKLVLFSGTPCQIHGLKLFLGKEYENLISIDLACHGVPSPKVFRKHLQDLEKTYRSRVVGFHFRAKNTGWKDFSSVAKLENGADQAKRHGDCPFMKGFLSNLYLRNSCYHCQNKGENRYSDMTLGDYWGVQGREPGWDDDKGTSVVFTRTEKGKDVLQTIHGDVTIKLTDKEWAENCNVAIVSPVAMNPNRANFFGDFEKAETESVSLETLIRPYLPKRTFVMKVKAMLPQAFKNRVKRMLGIGGGCTSQEISWKNYYVAAEFDDGQVYAVPHGEDCFMKGFLQNLYLRPSCNHCVNKADNRFSDLTLADYWGVENREPDMDDNKGTSAILVHTDKGKRLVEAMDAFLHTKRTDLAYVIKCNPSIAFPSKANPGRNDFFRGM